MERAVLSKFAVITSRFVEKYRLIKSVANKRIRDEGVYGLMVYRVIILT